jgi:hypothetical protein
MMGVKIYTLRGKRYLGVKLMSVYKSAVLMLLSLATAYFSQTTLRAADDCCPLLAGSDLIRYFDGNSFAFTAPCPSVSCYPSYAFNGTYPVASTSYYTPGYYSSAYGAKNIVPPPVAARNPLPWPYFYTPAGDYTPGYYSYYYTPRFFRD